MNNKISLAGDLGSGKSTVSAILTEKLSMEYYSTGKIVRAIADKMGMSIIEFNKYMETHPEVDKEIDDGLASLSSDSRSLIIDSRMAWHFVKGTFPVYLTTEIDTAAARIMYANRRGEHALSLEDSISETLARRESEKIRYSEKYGVDITDLSNYSLVVDTTVASPEEIADTIAAAYKLWQNSTDAKFAFISPERLRYIDDAVDAEVLMELSDLVDAGLPVPEISVFYESGNFYIEEGTASALAYAFSMRSLVPVKLITGAVAGRTFVSMKNSL